MRTVTVRRPQTCLFVGKFGLLALARVIPASLAAQSIRGVVVEGHDRPMAGVAIVIWTRR